MTPAEQLAYQASLLSTLAAEVQLLRTEFAAARTEARLQHLALLQRIGGGSVAAADWGGADWTGGPVGSAPAAVVVGPGGESIDVQAGADPAAPARGYDVQRPPGFVPPEYEGIDAKIAAEVDRYHPRAKWHPELQAKLPDNIYGKAEFGRRLGRAAEINGFDPALRIDYRAESGQYMTAAQWSAWLAEHGGAGGNTVVGPT